MRAFPLLTAAIFLASSCLALYEDQKGQNDWYRQALGHVTHATFLSRKPRLLVATQQSLLAALNLRDGDILWRKRLAEDDQIQGLAAFEGPGLLVTLSGGGRNLRAWELQHGLAVWERSLPAPQLDLKSGATVLKGSSGLEQPLVVVLQDGELEAFDVEDGQTLWRLEVGSEMESVAAAAVLGTEQGFVVGLVDSRNGQAQLLRVSETGSVTSSTTFESPMDLSMSISISEDSLSVASLDKSSVCVGTSTQPDILSCHKFPTFFDQVVSSEAGVTQRGPQPLDVSTISHCKELHMLPGVAAISRLIDEEYDNKVIGMVIPNEEGIALSIVDSNDWEELLKEDYNNVQIGGTVGPSGHISQLYLGHYHRKDGSVGYRALVVGEDSRMSLLQQGQIVWTREEGLAFIESTLFIDPPASSSQGHQGFNMMDRLRAQILTLKSQFHLQSIEEEQELALMKKELGGQHLNVRDSNGIRKLIIGLSSTMVYALHNSDGRVIWSRMLEGMAPSRLFLYRYSHTLRESPWIAIISNTVCLILDAHTGEIAEQIQLPGTYNKIIEVPGVAKMGDRDQHAFILTQSSTTGAQAHLLPDLQSTRSLLKNLGEISTWTSDEASGIMKGFLLEKETMRFYEQWSLALHSNILAVAVRDPAEAVHSHVKVLGDRTLKYKYLNPNTVFVATGIPDGTPSAAMDPAGVDLTIHIIDTITGRIIFRQVHQGARGPVKALCSQHAMMYTYWSTQNSRFEISVMELYDESHKLIDIWNLMFFSGAAEKISSHNPVPIEVMRSSHSISTPVRVLGGTRTLKGITSQRILIGTIGDQVYSMDTKYVDPRRPRGQATAETKGERLIPYQELLVLYPTKYLSQDRQILGLKRIDSSPTGLESGSHVLAYGIDIFYTRVQPEKAFDSLEEDFAFAFLVLTIVAMLVGALVMHHIVKKSKLSQKWK